MNHPSQTTRDAGNALARTVLDAGASMTIASGERSVTIGAKPAEETANPGHVSDRPDERADAPFDSRFGGRDYLKAPELEAIAEALIERYEEFSFLRRYGARVKCRWKRKGGKSKGRDTYGNTQKTSGLLDHFAECDFVIWIAADHVRESGWTNLQLEAQLYHELSHIGFTMDEDENSATYGEITLAIRGHDDELFHDELKRYGAWNQQRRVTEQLYTQIALPAGGDA
jgi:hypothetical protein